MSKKQSQFASRQFFYLLFITILLFQCAAGLNAQTPAPDHDRFSQEINAFIQWDRKNSFPEHAVLFVGSSSIRLWNTASSFPKLTVINRGFGGSEISDVNHYYEHVVKQYNPARIVFYAGDNDIAAGKSANQVFGDFQLFIEKVEHDFPETDVFYLPIKPSISRWKLWPEMAVANGKIKAFIETKPNLFYVDTATPMLDETTRPRPELFMDDGLHLNERGYQLWNGILSSYLENN
jgi:lysophospholipase L1-like esterase